MNINPIAINFDPAKKLKENKKIHKFEVRMHDIAEIIANDPALWREFQDHVASSNIMITNSALLQFFHSYVKENEKEFFTAYEKNLKKQKQHKKRNLSVQFNFTSGEYSAKQNNEDENIIESITSLISNVFVDSRHESNLQRKGVKRHHFHHKKQEHNDNIIDAIRNSIKDKNVMAGIREREKEGNAFPQFPSKKQDNNENIIEALLKALKAKEKEREGNQQSRSPFHPKKQDSNDNMIEAFINNIKANNNLKDKEKEDYYSNYKKDHNDNIIDVIRNSINIKGNNNMEDNTFSCTMWNNVSKKKKCFGEINLRNWINFEMLDVKD